MGKSLVSCFLTHGVKLNEWSGFCANLCYGNTSGVEVDRAIF